MPKKLKRLLLILAAGLALFVAAGIVLGIVYEDEVKQQIVHEVNQGLNTEISVDGISLSIFKKFPYAALHFEKLMALDAIETNAPKDTLLYAEGLFLEFNLLDIFTRKYTIRKVDVSNAVLRLKIDENGNDNFHFWKTRGDTTTAHLAFELAEVGLHDVDFSFRSVQTSFHLNTQIDYMDLSGNFQAAVFDLNAQSKLLVQTLTADQTEYLHNQPTELSLITRIDTRNKRYEVDQGSVDFGMLAFLVDGYFQDGDEQLLDLKLKGKKLDIPTLLAAIPGRFVTALDGYKPEGKTSFGLHLRANLSNPETPAEVTADFDVANAGVEHLKSGLRFKDFSASGHYEHIGNHPDLLRLEQFNFNLKDGHLGGKGSIRNFKRPLIQFSLNGKAELADLQELLEIRAIEHIQGTVALECQFKGIVADTKKISGSDLNNAEISGQLEFKNTSFKIRNHKHRYHNINGSFFLSGNNAAFKDLNGNIHSSDIQLDGAFINFVPFVLVEKEELTIQAQLKSSHLNLAELLVEDAEKSDTSNFHLKLPSYVNVNVITEVDELTFNTFRAENIRGTIRINESGIWADPLTFETSRGTFNSSLSVKPTGKNMFSVRSSAEIRNIDVQQIFEEFGNFGQKFITADHLRGTADADVTFDADISSGLKISPASIHSLVDIDIADGELIGLQSLTEVANYIRQNKLLAPLVKTDDLKKKLQHIEFSRLQNQIKISDSKVHIPEMELETSAMNLAVSGWHGFNSHVDYRIRFRLAEILTHNSHSEFGDIKDDGSGGSFFLKMSGPLSNLNFAYDRASAKEQRREYFQQEKQTFKELLREEFGSKKKDTQTPPGSKPDKSKETGIVIEPVPDKKQSEKDDFWDELEEDDDF